MPDILPDPKRSAPATGSPPETALRAAAQTLHNYSDDRKKNTLTGSLHAAASDLSLKQLLELAKQTGVRIIIEPME